MTFEHASVGVLAASAIGIGALGLSRPERLARLVGTDASTARAIGGRDLTNGVLLLLARDKRPVLAARALNDLSDAWRFGRADRRVLLASLASAALAALAYRRAVGEP